MGRDHKPSWGLAALIALIGFQLRSVIVGVPPVLPDLRSDLHLTFSAIGALTAIPVLGLGAAAIPGAILVDRFGARRVVSVATLGMGVTALLRVTPPVPYSLFLWTALLSVSIAIAQPGVTVLIRSWFPHRVQQASTIYATSLSLGALAGATISVYLLMFGGWRGTFVIWALVVLVSAGLWISLAPGRGIPHDPVAHGLGRLVRERQVWHVAALFGTQSLVFFGGITWIPFLLRGYSPDYLALVLFLFQVVSIPLIAILAMVRLPWARSRAWYTVGGALMTVGSLGFLSGLTGLAWLWAPAAGLGSGMVFAGATALPAILARTTAEVAGYTALTLTFGYAVSFLGPLLGGILLDYTHLSTAPFWVIAVAAAIATLLGAALPNGLPRQTERRSTGSRDGSSGRPSVGP